MGNLRVVTLLVSLLLFPVTLNYMSPVISVMGAFEGVIAGSVLLFAALFASSVFLGRLWCGWLCPGGALQDLVCPLNGRRPGRRADSVKYFIWAVWFGSMIFILLESWGNLRLRPLFMTEGFVSVDEPYKFLIYYIVVLVLLAAAVTVGRRGACHSICWMAPFMVYGMALGSVARVPALHISMDPKPCVNCGLCARACPMGLDPVASAGSSDVPYECVNCGECVRACGKKALRFGFGPRSRS